MGKIIAMGLLFFVLSAFLYKITYSGHVTETNSKDFSRKYKDLHAYTESVLYISSRTNWLNETEFAEFEFFESDLSGLPFNDSFGGIFSYDAWNSYDTETRFKLSHVKLYAVNVPEPSSISLILFSSGFILLRRKFKHCQQQN